MDSWHEYLLGLTVNLCFSPNTRFVVPQRGVPVVASGNADKHNRPLSPIVNDLWDVWIERTKYSVTSR